MCAVGVSLGHLWKNGPLTFDLVASALIVPSVSAALLVCISLGVPELYSVNALRFPLNLTLPVIYTALLLVTTALMSHMWPSIMRMPDKLEAIETWGNGYVLFVTLLAGVLCLSVLALLERE